MNKKVFVRIGAGVVAVAIGAVSIIGYKHVMKRNHILAGTLIDEALAVNLDGGKAFVREVNTPCEGTHYIDIMSGKEYHQISEDSPSCDSTLIKKVPARTITGGYPAYYDFTSEELSDGKISEDEVIAAVGRGR